MSLYFDTVQQLRKLLVNVDGWMEKATVFAKQKNDFPVDAYLNMRLAPDQYTLVRQVQACADSAKFLAARLTGKTPPSHPDVESTFEELRERVKSVVSYLDSFKEGDFDGADDRHVTVPYIPGKYALGAHYFVEQATPNFYFHLVHVYAILRHAGVNLGKMDFMGSVKLKDLGT